MRVIDEEDYLGLHGVGGYCWGDPALHKQPGATPKEISRRARRSFEQDEVLQQRKNALRREYRAMVEQGEARGLTRREKLIRTANGHPDRESVQAARRICRRQGIDWRGEA